MCDIRIYDSVHMTELSVCVLSIILIIYYLPLVKQKDGKKCQDCIESIDVTTDLKLRIM